MKNNGTNIEMIFKHIRLDKMMSVKQREFVRGLKSYFEHFDYLTDKQFDCLTEAYLTQKKKLNKDTSVNQEWTEIVNEIKRKHKIN